MTLEINSVACIADSFIGMIAGMTLSIGLFFTIMVIGPQGVPAASAAIIAWLSQVSQAPG